MRDIGLRIDNDQTWPGAEWRLRAIEAPERRPALRLAWRPAKETRRRFLDFGFTPGFMPASSNS
jgi:hypothetical protein